MEKIMANIHMFLTGKGGVGKSFCSAMLMQYIMDSGRQNPVCIDTDPVNATLYAYKAFNAIGLKLWMIMEYFLENLMKS